MKEKDVLKGNSVIGNNSENLGNNSRDAMSEQNERKKEAEACRKYMEMPACCLKHWKQ